MARPDNKPAISYHEILPVLLELATTLQGQSDNLTLQITAVHSQ
jgi:hypothetical protein